MSRRDAGGDDTEAAEDELGCVLEAARAAVHSGAAARTAVTPGSRCEKEVQQLARASCGETFWGAAVVHRTVWRHRVRFSIFYTLAQFGCQQLSLYICGVLFYVININTLVFIYI